MQDYEDDFEDDFGDDEEVTPVRKRFADDDDSDDGYEIEIVDDTPEEDRGRKPLETDDESHEEEVESYSKRVKKRIDQLNHRVHDERREKERLAREHEEALRLAQMIVDENEQLKRTLTWGQQEYTKEATTRLDYAQKLAQDKYRKAFESGDTDGVIDAQEELNALAIERSRVANLQIAQTQSAPPKNTLQRESNTVYSNTNTAPAPPPRDYKAENWASRNPWFGKDEEMTAFAYGLHEKLVKSGVDPTSDEYYERVDSRMREVFPSNFKRSKRTSNVASVGRTSASKKVIALTKSQVAIAKRLGVTPEQYAQHVIKLEKRNG